MSIRSAKKNAKKKKVRKEALAQKERKLRPLTKEQLQFLKERGHHLEPVLSVGKDGITEGVVKACAEQLLAHELIKARVQSEASPGGGTGWLNVAGNVKPGETVEIRFVLWDTGDPWYDSLVLLDNFVGTDGDVTKLRAAVERAGGRILLEASGGVTHETLPAIARTGVHYASLGALTHSAGSLDFSLEVVL